jgi:predicted trehalose synthase
VHGDLHVGQFLHAPGRTVVVDFEGLPARAPAERRALDTPLRDLASLARSIDHCGRYAVERHGGRPALVEAWIDEARSELLAGCGPHDEALLRALEFDRAVYEFTYASRYLPDWLYAPPAALAALLRR